MQTIHGQMGKIMPIAILIAIYLFAPVPNYLSNLCDRPVLSALTHHFFHLNVMHLAVNCMALYFYISINRGRRWMYATAFIIGTMAYAFALRPCIGLSNFLFALLGLYTPSLKHSWWKSSNTIIFLSVTIAMLLLPSVSAITHIGAFATGVAVAALRRQVKQLNNDLNHASRPE